MPGRYLLKTVTKDAPSGPVDLDVTDAANELIPPQGLTQNAEIIYLCANSGSAPAYFGTAADVAVDSGGTVVTTNLVIPAGATGVEIGPFAADKTADLRLRIFQNAVLVITPIYTPR